MKKKLITSKKRDTRKIIFNNLRFEIFKCIPCMPKNVNEEKRIRRIHYVKDLMSKKKWVIRRKTKDFISSFNVTIDLLSKEE